MSEELDQLTLKSTMDGSLNSFELKDSEARESIQYVRSELSSSIRDTGRSLSGQIASLDTKLTNRVDNIVASAGTEGTSSSEVVDARQSSATGTHNTLSARLNADYEKLSARVDELASAISRLSSNSGN